MLSGFMTYLVIKTKSILLAIFMHASINALTNFGFGLPINEHSISLYLSLTTLVIISLVLVYRIDRK